jgi:tRNA modification GTPase
MSWSDADARLVKRLDPARTLIVGSKKDLLPPGAEVVALEALLARVSRASHVERWQSCVVSAMTGEGVDEVRQAITQLVTGDEGVHLEEPVLATERQRSLVEEACGNVRAAQEGAAGRRDEELICEDIRAAIQALGRMTGEDLTSDLLDEIFSRFCIGK